MRKKGKPFCGGVCEEWKRHRYKCMNCKKYLCKVCIRKFKKKVYCPNCYILKIDLIKEFGKAIKEVFR